MGVREKGKINGVTSALMGMAFPELPGSVAGTATGENLARQRRPAGSTSRVPQEIAAAEEAGAPGMRPDLVSCFEFRVMI